MKEANHSETSMELFTLLVRHVGYGNNAEWAAATGVELKSKSRTFMFMELVGVDREDVRDMAGIKSNHCFVTASGCIWIFPTSCTCLPCRAMKYEECHLVTTGERGKGKQMKLDAYIPAIQGKRSNFEATLKRGRAVLAECR